MLVGTTARRVAIVGGVRIPFARGNGAYAEVGNQEMLTAALRAVVERYGLQGQRLDDVAAGGAPPKGIRANGTSPASPCSDPDSPRRPRDSTCSAPAAPASRPPFSSAIK